MLKAHAEAYQPTDAELEARERQYEQRQHRRALEKAISSAEEAFRAKDDARVVDLLAPFEDELEKIPSAKLASARKRQDIS